MLETAPTRSNSGRRAGVQVSKIWSLMKRTFSQSLSTRLKRGEHLHQLKSFGSIRCHLANPHWFEDSYCRNLIHGHQLRHRNETSEIRLDQDDAILNSQLLSPYK